MNIRVITIYQVECEMCGILPYDFDSQAKAKEYVHKHREEHKEVDRNERVTR